MSNRTVLIVSDRSDSIPAWEDAFRQRGLRVIATPSLAVVENQWRINAPVLTVVDTSHGNPHNLEVCRRLRMLAPAPILLILTAPSDEDITKAYQAGVTECLIQPTSPAVILLKALAWSMRRAWMELPLPHDPPPAGIYSRANP